MEIIRLFREWLCKDELAEIRVENTRLRREVDTLSDKNYDVRIEYEDLQRDLETLKKQSAYWKGRANKK